MSISRRGFLKAATATGAAIALPGAQSEPVAAPQRITMRKEIGAGLTAAAGEAGRTGVAIPSPAAMASGAPLGGIGTGYISLRPDGSFYDWLIFNSGDWAGDRPASQSSVEPDMGPQSLRFFLWTRESDAPVAKLRRLSLDPESNNLYSLGWAQNVESTEYDAWYPMTGIHYNDSTLPVRVKSVAFSPFIPGHARESATPGFHMVFTVENTSRAKVEISLLSILDNPLAWGQANRDLVSSIERKGDTTSLLMQTEAQPENTTTIGNMCLSVTGGDASWIRGTFRQYMSPDLCRWKSPRANHGFMVLSVLQDYVKTGRLPGTESERDSSSFFTLSDAQIDALPQSEVNSWLGRLSGDALVNRVVTEALAGDPSLFSSAAQLKELLKEIGRNLSANQSGKDRAPSDWGTGALASTVELAPGQSVEIRFALSWFFPHHYSRYGQDMGHMYSNWFSDAKDVNAFLVENYASHRQQTELFARTLADTSLGAPLAFAWSSHLGTAITNTWWVKDGNYAIWEGLGCCGLSTMDTEYDGSFSQVALFPELKMGQMRHMLKLQNERGQVPHTYDGDFDHVDEGGWGRVDMNPQFVMMVYRDYLWTGDRAYLEFMWPHVLKAMRYTGSLDADGDGLPDHDCSLQTYDQWGMRGVPSYIASLWIGALKAAIRIAGEMKQAKMAGDWQETLQKASASFDRLLFNGSYYSLWVDGKTRDETLMSDQVSGEWFGHLIGMPTTISEQNLALAAESIWKKNFSPETGLRNATVPKEKRYFLMLDNLQAGGVWSGIEFAFASFLMDHERFDDGAAIVSAVHRRYLRAGTPWNHIECGNHYSRPMSSWATLLGATGFKPDLSAEMLTLTPGIRGDFRAPWATPFGFGSVERKADAMHIICRHGQLPLKTLKVNRRGVRGVISLDGRSLDSAAAVEGALIRIDCRRRVVLAAGQTITIQ
jgi:uncharacterized protein (DUF608 family)